MKIITGTIEIQASPETIWDAITKDYWYRIWTSAFTPGSRFKGTWETGNNIYFMAPNEEGMMNGIASLVKNATPYKSIHLEHQGLYMDGIVDTESEEAKKWAPSFEKYFLENNGEYTTFQYELQAQEEWADDMEKMWESAMQELKKCCENRIMVFADIKSPIEIVWEKWNTPEDITKWAFASDDWHCPKAINDLSIGGKFVTTMAAKDASTSFDFSGTYSEVRNLDSIAYEMEDGRKVWIFFYAHEAGTRVVEIFDPETENSKEMQKEGWQAIINNFAKHVAS